MTDESSMIPRKERVRLYPAEGVVLRRRDLGEADRILTLFTDRHGKLSVVAKGVRRTQSRLAGHLEPFARTNLLLAKGRNLDIVTQAALIDPFLSVHQDEQLIAYAGYFADLLDAFSGEGQENRPAYELLLTSLARLDSGCDPFVSSTFFEYRLLSLMGFQPELFKCINCGEDLRPVENGFSLAGGVVCPNCLPFDPRTTPLSVNALKYLRLIERGEFTTALRLRLPPELRGEIDRALRGYVGSVLEREPRSLAVLRMIAN
ncbi:MAG TPA: DNA repair protein RecO [Nitrolancea sp.]|nr:DNA repair protein RecO [Nitrolancea sp.]